MKHLFSDTWIELISGQRNRAYGALALRRLAHTHQVYGLIMANTICLIIIFAYQIYLKPRPVSDLPASTLANHKEIEARHNTSKPSEEELRIVAVESIVDFGFLNIRPLEEAASMEKPGQEPVAAIDISDGVMKYAVDKNGQQYTPQKCAAFAGGMDSFYVSVRKQIGFKSALGLPNYRYENGDDEIDFEINTLVFVECVVTTTGRLDSVKLFKGASDPKFNERVLEAFKKSGKWKPAMHQGVAVAQKMIIPFHFDYKQPLIKYYF